MGGADRVERGIGLLASPSGLIQLYYCGSYGGAVYRSVEASTCLRLVRRTTHESCASSTDLIVKRGQYAYDSMLAWPLRPALAYALFFTKTS